MSQHHGGSNHIRWSISSIVGPASYEGPRYRDEPHVRLECGCGARAWQRDKPGMPCAFCGREPMVAH